MYSEKDICKEYNLLPGMVLKVNHKRGPGSVKEELTVIQSYPRFVLCKTDAGYNVAILKKDLVFKEAVEW